MAEYLPEETAEYVADNIDTLTAIHANILRLINPPQYEAAIDMPSVTVVAINGIQSAEDRLADDPQLSQSDAETYESIEYATATSLARMSALNLSSMEMMHQVAHFAQALQSEGVAAEEITERLESFEPDKPASASWQGTRYVLTNPNRNVALYHTRLRDANGLQTAENVGLEIFDQLLVYRFSLVFINDQVLSVHADFSPLQDKLIERAYTLLGEDYSKAFLLMSGRVPNADPNVVLNDLWLAYQGSSKEQEIGPLLDEIRDRYYAVQESTVLSLQLGEGRPSFQDLHDTNNFLSNIPHN